jgi:hypothetical protein
MKTLAAKGRNSNLVNSIRPTQVDDLTWDIGPNPDFVGKNGERPFTYAAYVERGVKPGGKGLPRFFDPKAKSIVDWLESRPPSRFMGPPRQGRKHKAKMGSPALQRDEKDLRSRYFGLFLHVRKFGIKAQPFVEPTAKEMEPVVLTRMNEAVRRVLAARPGDAGALA